jgi:CBS domain-containing protein
MHVKDVMNPKATLVNPSTSIKEAAAKMEQDRVGFLPVGENDRLQGTVTDRDIVIRAISKGKDPQTTSIDEVLTSELVYCTEDQDVDDVARIMGDRQVRRLPVVNADKRLVGIVSIGDMAQHLSRDTAGQVLAQVTA